jgi:hypothetical protein
MAMCAAAALPLGLAPNATVIITEVTTLTSEPPRDQCRQVVTSDDHSTAPLLRHRHPDLAPHLHQRELQNFDLKRIQ